MTAEARRPEQPGDLAIPAAGRHPTASGAQGFDCFPRIGYALGSRPHPISTSMTRSRGAFGFGLYFDGRLLYTWAM